MCVHVSRAQTDGSAVQGLYMYVCCHIGLFACTFQYWLLTESRSCTYTCEWGFNRVGGKDASADYARLSLLEFYSLMLRNIAIIRAIL